MKRDTSFFNSDVFAGAEDLAYRLADDYGLNEDDAGKLTEAVESTVQGFFVMVRDRDEAS